MKNTKTLPKFYLAFDYDKEEADINAMAEKGWQLKTGASFYHMYERSDRKYRYRLDYNPKALMDYEEKHRYLELFEEQGWEMISSTFNGWFYFRKLSLDGYNESDYIIYTDDSSLLDMLSRWMKIARILEIYSIACIILELVCYIEARRSFMLITILMCAFGVVLMQLGISVMKKKKANPHEYKRRGVVLGYIAFTGMILSLILFFVFGSGIPYVYHMEIDTRINSSTSDFTDTFEVKKDGIYYVNVDVINDRGGVMVRLLRDGDVVFNAGGTEFSVSKQEQKLKKGTYSIDVIYCLEDYGEYFDATKENLLEANLNGNLSELEDIQIIVGIGR